MVNFPPLLALLLALFLAGNVAGQELKLPKEIRGVVGRPLKIVAETSAKKVRWKTYGELQQVVREDLADPRTCVVFACRPGTYHLGAWCATAEGDATEEQICAITLSDAPLPPPGPGPGPGPGPPLPDLASSLRDLYRLDADPAKARQLRALATVWRQSVAYAADADLRTLGQLLGVVREAAGKLVPAESLIGIRKRIAEELRSSLPADGETALTEDLRKRAAEVFSRVASALEGLP